MMSKETTLEVWGHTWKKMFLGFSECLTVVSFTAHIISYDNLEISYLRARIKSVINLLGTTEKSSHWETFYLFSLFSMYKSVCMLLYLEILSASHLIWSCLRQALMTTTGGLMCSTDLLLCFKVLNEN